MTARSLITGSLFRDPEQKTSKTGRPYVTATLKVKDGDGFTFWRLTAFSESVSAELMRLSEGDSVSAQGALKVETYEKDGATKISLSLIADQILALRQPRERPAGEQNRAARYRRPVAQGKPASEPRRRDASLTPRFHRTDAPHAPRSHAGHGAPHPDLNDDIDF